ncbi:MAG: hypothetical protein HXY24_12580 [Rubrivivax sp.]|nr:hypothetical protein [Rubrivivax sp.]
MIRATLAFISAGLFFVVTAGSDTLVLRNGKPLNGVLVGASARQIDFLVSGGKTERIPITDIDRIVFSAPAPAASGGAPVSANKPPAPKPPVIIPKGTAIRARNINAIDVDAAQAGAKFKATIDEPITIGGKVIVPRGAEATLQAVKVQQSGRMKGKDLIQLKLSSVVIHGSPYPMATTFQEIAGGSEGKKTGRKLIGGAGLGAIVGGIAGGGKGAAIGAAAGAAGGALISAAGEQHLKVPAETRLEFRLETDVKI